MLAEHIPALVIIAGLGLAPMTAYGDGALSGAAAGGGGTAAGTATAVGAATGGMGTGAIVGIGVGVLGIIGVGVELSTSEGGSDSNATPTAN